MTQFGPILLADALAPECAQVFAEHGIDTVEASADSLAIKVEKLQACTGMIVRSATKVDEAMLDAAPQLKVIGRAGSGVDNIDVAAATSRGVLVMNAPGLNTLSAAEHAFTLLMAAARNIGAADSRMSEGGWGKKGLMGIELHGKTFGVVGLGRIGREVAARGRAFGMKVLGYDPYLPAETAERLGIQLVSLEEMWPKIDALSLHSPLTDETQHLLGKDQLAQCRDGLLVVNAARGGLVDETALLNALDTGRVAAAGFDVFEQEPPAQDHPLRVHPRVVCTPHLGASTTEAQEKVAAGIAHQLVDFLQHGTVNNAVNMPSVDAATAALLLPWQHLASTMGKIHAHSLDGRIESIEIESAGDLGELPLSALVAAALQGMLNRLLSRRVNVVNAQAIAKEQGYPVREVHSEDAAGYQAFLQMHVRTDGGEHLLRGTVFGGTHPRLVQVDSWHVEIEPKGEMLLVINDDSPGRLAEITGLIARHGVNIGNMALGRSRDLGNACCALRLDEPFPDEALKELQTIPGILHALRMTLNPN